jgi:uncharacterized membrane protein YbhN (UPF0104 family)
MTDPRFENQLKIMNRFYRTILISLLAVIVLAFVLYFLLPGVSTLTREEALVSKSIMIILFLSVVPLMLSYMKRQLARIPRESTPVDQLLVYKRHFYRKAIALAILCVLSLVVFLLTGDPMILLLLVAGILFLYFERPGRLKVLTDLDMEEED